jgi:anhydro-N-acetylmuramic acid kinase
VSKLYTAVGLMSGTSLDGIDIALIKTDGETEVSHGPSRTYPYVPAQRAMLEDALKDSLAIRERRERPGSLAQTEWSLTEWHALAVESFCQDFGLTDSDIDVIGFHGQTVIHKPERRLTVQLGDGPLLARRLKAQVVHDLRADDIAAGGQGAPLLPVYHRALAQSLEVLPLAFLDIGRVSTVTWIGADDELIAFDTGPGNALIDDWVLKMTGSVALSRAWFPADPKCWVICGDGRNNPALMAALRASLGLGAEAVIPAEAAGFNSESMEAESCAYLAVRSLKQLPITFPGTTGVPEPMTGGHLAEV